MPKKMALIATKGTLDMAYPPFILASTAAALGWDVQIFFTFYGLQLLRKNLDSIKISPLANPAMPMPVPMPVFVQMLPGAGVHEERADMDMGVPREQLVGQIVDPQLAHRPQVGEDLPVVGVRGAHQDHRRAGAKTRRHPDRADVHASFLGTSEA